MLHASISQEGCSGGADKFGNTSDSDVNQGHMCCQRCFVLQVEQCYGACANNQGDQCQITGVELPEPESAKTTGVYKDQEPMLPEPKGSMSELFLMEGCPKICLWWTNLPLSQFDARNHPRQ